MSGTIKQKIAWVFISLVVITGMLLMGSRPVYAEGATIETVRAAIQALSADPTEFTAGDKETVEAIQTDFNALSAEDQATLDAECTHSGTAQSLGRVLESAVWAVRSYETDTSTTLSSGTYTTTTEPAVSSVSNKGKSDSSRTRNWWVESVVVENGQAVANIYVTSGAATAGKLTSYPSVWAGGKTIDRNADNTYTIPVDLNGTTYFGGISSTMPTPIMYSLSAAIEEPKPVDPPAKADYTAVDAALASIPSDLTIYTDETVAAVTAAADAVVRDKPATAQSEVDAMAVAINNAVTSLKEKPADYSAVDAALATVPADLTIYTDETVAVVTYAVNAVVRDKTITAQAAVDAMAQAINDAVIALELKGEPIEEKADYTAVDTALASIPTDLNNYTDETVSAVTAARNAVVRGKPVSAQLEVDAMAKALNDAVAALILKPGDYTAVDAALASIPKDLSKYTDKTAQAVTSAIASVVRGKLITEQSEVDAMAQAITNAVNSLKLKKKAKITILKKTNIIKYKSGGKKLKKTKTFSIKTKASSKAAVTYQKVKKGKISINKKGKVTLKKGLKKGKYTIKVKASAPATSTYKAVTRTITIKITIK